MELRTLRRSRRLTIRDAAAQVGVTRDMFWRWENGQGVPRADLLPGLARVLGVTVEEIVAMFAPTDDPGTERQAAAL